MAKKPDSRKPEERWPKGHAKFYNQIRAAAPLLLNGTVLAVDPGSTAPGYALYQAGKLVKSGTLAVPKVVVYDRLRWISRTLSEMFPTECDALVIEEIRGAGRFSSYILHWAIGTIIPAIKSRIVIELPINVWHTLSKADPTYVKNDTRDSELIGEAAIRLAIELTQPKE